MFWLLRGNCPARVMACACAYWRRFPSKTLWSPSSQLGRPFSCLLWAPGATSFRTEPLSTSGVRATTERKQHAPPAMSFRPLPPSLTRLGVHLAALTGYLRTGDGQRVVSDLDQPVDELEAFATHCRRQMTLLASSGRMRAIIVDNPAVRRLDSLDRDLNVVRDREGLLPADYPPGAGRADPRRTPASRQRRSLLQPAGRRLRKPRRATVPRPLEPSGPFDW